MSKKKQIRGEEEDKAAADYYKLNRQAVDDLVNANEENSPEVSEEELRKYRSGTRRFKVADWVKILFVKFWFPAAVCYFMIWGLGVYVSDLLDLLFITGIAMGIVTDLLTNNLLRFLGETEGENDRWMMFPKKRFITFIFNILYAWVVLFLVFTIYTMLNSLVASVTGQPEQVALGVEPILFGIFYVAFDSLLIGAKHLLGRILDDAKNSAKKG